MRRGRSRARPGAALSMHHTGELKLAGRTITAAPLYFAGQPETELRLGVNQAGNACLQGGWSEPLEGSVGARGFESRLKLPRPVAMDDFVLALDVSPTAAPPAPIPQHVVAAGNGAVVLESSLTERQTPRCSLSRRTIEADETLCVTLLRPDANVCASEVHPLNGPTVVVVLHGVSLKAAPAHAAKCPSMVSAGLRPIGRRRTSGRPLRWLAFSRGRYSRAPGR
jgi:hypothetical protein